MHSRRRRPSPTLIVLLVLASAIPALAKPPLFEPAELSSADGSQWSGIVFDATTKQELSKLWRTSMSGPRATDWLDRLVRRDDTEHPRSTFLVRPRGEPGQYVALLSETGPNAHVTHVYLADAPVPEPEFTEQLAADHVRYYPMRRYDDWWLDLYPSKGILAVVHGAESGDRVLYQVVSSSRRLQPLGATIVQTALGLSPNVTAITRYVDPHAGEQKIITFGRVNASFSLRNATVEYGEKDRLENSLYSLTAGGAARYVSGTPGTLSATVSISWSQKEGGSVSVNLKLEGNSPYGEVTASGQSYQTLPKGDAATCNGSMWYTYALRDARQKLEANIGQKLAQQGPPTLDELRAQSCSSLIEQLREVPSETQAAVE